MKNLRSSLLSASVIALVSASPAYADSKDERIATMEQQLKIMMQEIQSLKAERQAEHQDYLKLQQQVQTLQAQSVEPAAGNKTEGVKISMNPSPKFESADGNYSFQPFGRVHLDATFFDDDVADHPNNGNFRRARLGAKGKLGKDIEYKTEIDFGEEAVNFKEVTLTYTGLDAADIKIGHHKPSFGMEQNTSSNYMMFIERSAATNAFTRDEEIGLNITGGGDNWSLSGGIFNQDAAPSAGDPDEDVTFDTRASLNVLGLTESNNVLHIGAGYSHRYPSGSINFDAAPAGEGPDVIDTTAINAVKSVNVYNAELAGVFGPFSFQSEYFYADVNRSAGNSDAQFDGYYGQAGWLLTGETRPYKGKTGNFSRIKPQKPFDLEKGHWGAWEILARHEYVDLNDTSAGITGGELNSNAVGINWHLTDYVRFMGNVVAIDTDSNAPTANDDPTVYNLRAQWDF